MFILSGPYHRSRLFLAPDEGGGTGTEAPPAPKREATALDSGMFTQASTSSEDELPPDFSALEAKFGDAKGVVEQPPDQTTTVAPQEKPEEKGEKPAPDGKEDHPSDPARYKDGTFKPKAGAEIDVEFPPEKPPVPEKKPETKPPEAKPAEAPKPEEKPPEPPKPEEKGIPKDDADLDAIKPKPGSSPKIENDFERLKGEVKKARSHARELETKLTEATTKASGELPEEIKAKLAEAEENANFRAMFELENEPKARAAYQEKLTKSEEAIISRLVTDPRLKLPQADADKLKAATFDSPEGRAMVNKWVRQIRDGVTDAGGNVRVPGDELLAQEVAGWFYDRNKIVQDRAAEVDKLRTNRDAYLKQRQEAEKGEYNEWCTKADKTLEQIANGHEWADYKREPAGATPEQKAAIEAHNKFVKEQVVPVINQAVLDVWDRKPEQTIQMVFDAMRLRFGAMPEIEKLKADLAASTSRIAELEGLANGVRRASSLSTAESAPSAPVTKVPDFIGGSKEASSDDALDAFLASRGGR